jgi:hypothetical protein
MLAGDTGKAAALNQNVSKFGMAGRRMLIWGGASRCRMGSTRWASIRRVSGARRPLPGQGLLLQRAAGAAARSAETDETNGTDETAEISGGWSLGWSY